MSRALALRNVKKHAKRRQAIGDKAVNEAHRLWLENRQTILVSNGSQPTTYPDGVGRSWLSKFLD
jgi:hypothetical protein